MVDVGGGWRMLNMMFWFFIGVSLCWVIMMNGVSNSVISVVIVSMCGMFVYVCLEKKL